MASGCVPQVLGAADRSHPPRKQVLYPPVSNTLVGGSGFPICCVPGWLWSGFMLALAGLSHIPSRRCPNFRHHASSSTQGSLFITGPRPPFPVNSSLDRWPSNPNRSFTTRLSAKRCGPSACRRARGTGSPNSVLSGFSVPNGDVGPMGQTGDPSFRAPEYSSGKVLFLCRRYRLLADRESV